MERDFVKIEGDVTVIASPTKKSLEIWSTAATKRINSDHIDLGIRETYRLPKNFTITWNGPFACSEKVQIDQMVWEGCPNGD